MNFQLKNYIFWDKSTDISEEYVASFFRVEGKAKQETSLKVGGRRLRP
jgi:hypothetical protein